MQNSLNIMYSHEREPEVAEFIADRADLVWRALRGVSLYDEADRIDVRAQEELRPLLPMMVVDGMHFRVTPTEKKFPLDVGITSPIGLIGRRAIRTGIISSLERDGSNAIRRNNETVPFFEGNILDIDPITPNYFVVINPRQDLIVSCNPYLNSTELVVKPPKHL